MMAEEKPQPRGVDLFVNRPFEGTVLSRACLTPLVPLIVAAYAAFLAMEQEIVISSSVLYVSSGGVNIGSLSNGQEWAPVHVSSPRCDNPSLPLTLGSGDAVEDLRLCRGSLQYVEFSLNTSLHNIDLQWSVVFSFAANDSIYVGMSGNPAVLKRVSPLTMSWSATAELTRNIHDSDIGFTDGTYGYVALRGGGSDPARLLKVNLGDMKQVSDMALPSMATEPTCAFIDGNGNAILGMQTNSRGYAYKVQLSGNMSIVGSPLRLSHIPKTCFHGVNDTGVFGADGSHGMKVDLNGTIGAMTEVGNWTFNGLNMLMSGSFIDESEYGYFLQANEEGTQRELLKFPLNQPFANPTIHTLDPGSNPPFTVISDGTNAYISSAVDTPATVTQVRLHDMTRVGGVDMEEKDGEIRDGVILDGFAYFLAASSPGRLVKLRHSPNLERTVTTADFMMAPETGPLRVSTLCLRESQNGGLVEEEVTYLNSVPETHVSPMEAVPIISTERRRYGGDIECRYVVSQTKIITTETMNVTMLGIIGAAGGFSGVVLSVFGIIASIARKREEKKKAKQQLREEEHEERERVMCNPMHAAEGP